MRRIWFLFYDALVIPAFWIILRVAALFNSKVRRGIRGRSNLFRELSRKIQSLPAGPRVWFHSSSMGEFEQAKPIIAALRSRNPSLSIIVSFFSPSGLEHSKTHRFADVVTYLPFDTRSNAQRFVDLIVPDIAVMVRYDIWPNHVSQLKSREIPVLIANATLRPTSMRLTWPLSNFHRYLYNDLTAILTVSGDDKDVFRRFGLSHPTIEVIGDTRYDQVMERKSEAKKKHLLPAGVRRGRKIFVVGSSWDEDERVVIPAFAELARRSGRPLMILVPHEPSVETLERIELSLDEHGLRSIRFSDLNDYTNENVVLVDSIGILVPLYQYATIAYVGGSFRQGIHNVLEPAVFGIPVVFGPKHSNSYEAVELVKRQGAFVVHSSEELLAVLKDMVSRGSAQKRAGEKALKLVKENVGATDRCITVLKRLMPSIR